MAGQAASNGAPPPGRAGAWGFTWRALMPIVLLVPVVLMAKPVPAGLAAGLPLIIAGQAIRIICLGYLGVSSRAQKPVIGNLITAGPYAYTRNPVYIANTAIAVGFAVIAFSGWGWKVAAAAAALVAAIYVTFYNFFVIPAEEEYLRQKFGRRYEEYCRAVRRWLPRLKPFPYKSGRFRWLPVIRTEPWTWLWISLLLAYFIYQMTH